MSGKRMKRSSEEKEKARGFLYGIQGKSRELCPKQEGTAGHQNWMNGWRNGREAYWNAETGIAGISTRNENHALG
jgi:ribosome modulation factor